LPHADDPCLGDEEKKAALARSAALQKAKQAGQPPAIFVANMQIVADECMGRYDKNAVMRAKANMPRLGRDLAKAAEAKGALYSNDPIRADGRTSAFRYYEAIGDHQEANRVLLKAVQTKSEDLRLSRRLGTSITDDTLRSTPPPEQDNPIIPRRRSGMSWQKWHRPMPID
jgi:hypothetical protein